MSKSTLLFKSDKRSVLPLSQGFVPEINVGAVRWHEGEFPLFAGPAIHQGDSIEVRLVEQRPCGRYCAGEHFDAFKRIHANDLYILGGKRVYKIEVSSRVNLNQLWRLNDTEVDVIESTDVNRQSETFENGDQVVDMEASGAIKLTIETQADKAAVWWDNNWRHYVDSKHAGKYVSVRDEKIIYSSRIIKGLLNKLKNSGLSPRKDCYVDYLPNDVSQIVPDELLDIR